MKQRKTKTRGAKAAPKASRVLEQTSGSRLRVRPAKPMRPRPITAQERAWLIRGLNSLATGEYVGTGVIDLDTGTPPPPGPPVDPQPYLDQLDNLVVVKKCNCGQKSCHTVDFRQSKKARHCGLVMTQTDDGRFLIISVNELTNELADLEIIGDD
jgi:hypothetical protein